MTLEHIAAAAADGDLQQRVAAHIATLGTVEGDPVAWAQAHRWEIAAHGTIADAYFSAVVSYIDRPGWRPGAITDAMIADAVTAILADEQPEQPEQPA